MSKLRASTLRWAFSMERVTILASMASPSGILSERITACRRSPAKILSSGSSKDRKKREEPGSPWRAARPRSWLSMRRDSWRSEPMMCRPPAATTSLCSFCQPSRISATRRSLLGGSERLVGLHLLDLGVGVAAEHDVRAAAGHVGRDGHHPRTAGLDHDLRLPRVLLGVEHLVRQPLLREHRGDELGVLDRGGAQEDGLAALVAVLHLADDGLELLLGRDEDLVVGVLADHRAVRGDEHRLQAVDVRELEGLGVGRAGHPRELLVEAEVVLEGDRGERLALVLDRDAFLGLHRLVQALGPAPALHHAAGELVDDHHLVVLDHVVLVAVVERVRAHPGVEVVHEHDVGRVVEARPRGEQPRLHHQLLGVLVALLGERHAVLLEVHPVVALALLVLLLDERGDERVDAPVEVRGVLGLARDDERRARLVDEDRVHLVDDRVVEAALEPLGDLRGHVVAQVVEAELVVGAVGDVGLVGGLLLGVVHLRHDDAHGEAQEAVDPPHPFRVAAGEVVVHRDDVHALAGERVEVGRQRGDERLALAGAHLGDLALVQRQAADELHVEVAHAEHALRGLADDREGLGQDLFERWRPAATFALSSGVLAARASSESFSMAGSSALMDSTVFRYCFRRRSLRLPKMALRTFANTGAGAWAGNDAKPAPTGPERGGNYKVKWGRPAGMQAPAGPELTGAGPREPCRPSCPARRTCWD